MGDKKISRRSFVGGTAGVAFGAMFVPRHVLGGTGYVPPSERLNIAVVGCGGQGMSDATELILGNENIVALADVDFGYVDRNLARRGKNRDGSANADGQKVVDAYTKAKRYADFRKMLDEQKDIDAVLCATPDHLHAVVAKTAMDLGKHVYCEKPLTWSVNEARLLRKMAAEKKVVTQMGNQGHSSNDARLINEWIQAGLIGPVHEVHVWTNRPIWPQGVPRPGKPDPQARNAGGGFGNDWTQKRVDIETAAAIAGPFSPPSTLNWDLWLGPAPEVPYHPIYHPFNWRGWLDWGTGALGDMGAHLIDHPFWALDLGLPISVEANGTPFGTDSEGMKVSYPLATKVVYSFAARGTQPAVKLNWYDGGLMAPRPDVLPDSVVLDRGGGVLIIGEKGVLSHETYGSKPKLYPESLMEQTKSVPQKYERIHTGHRINWAMAAKGHGKASSPFEYATRLTETMLLGVVALRTGYGRLLRYDGEAGKITNADVEHLMGREYRKGWSI
jgi:predicted dehydrogenase